MGYMGFGMQRWIYNRSLRKPFSKRGQIPSFSAIPKYSRTFKIIPHIPESKPKYVVIGIVTFISLLFLTKLYTNKFVLYSNNYTKVNQERLKAIDIEAFNFLLNSGKLHLKRNNISGAYSEFILAYKVNPNNKKLNQLLIETLSILCKKDISYCAELNGFLDNDY